MLCWAGHLWTATSVPVFYRFFTFAAMRSINLGWSMWHHHHLSTTFTYSDDTRILNHISCHQQHVPRYLCGGVDSRNTIYSTHIRCSGAPDLVLRYLIPLFTRTTLYYLSQHALSNSLMVIALRLVWVRRIICPLCPKWHATVKAPVRSVHQTGLMTFTYYLLANETCTE